MPQIAPDVTVVLTSYNGERHLARAIESILIQRGVELELVIVDDASHDSSPAIAAEYDDVRIRTAVLPTNKGLASALNYGIAMARAPLIARQDQDDVSLPDRLRRQIEVFERKPGIVLVGTWAEIITEFDGEWSAVGRHAHPDDDARLRLRLLWNNPFVHSSVMFRRDAFDQVGGYGVASNLVLPEDYDLWSRLSAVGELANVPAILVEYQQTPGGMSDVYRTRIQEGAVRISARNLALATGLSPTDDIVVGTARVLNSMTIERSSLGSALSRAFLFWRASARVRSDRAWLVAERVRWTAKIVIRSLFPRSQ